jgi:hypothetical protein
MRSIKKAYFALIFLSLTLFLLTGCGPTIFAAKETAKKAEETLTERFMKFTGLSYIRDELSKLKAHKVKLESEEKKGTVDLSDSASNSGAQSNEENDSGEELSTLPSQSSSTSGFPDNIYCEYWLYYPESGRESNSVIYYFKGNKIKVIFRSYGTEQYMICGEQTMYQIQNEGWLDRNFITAASVIKDSAYTCIGTETVNEYNCKVYRKDMKGVTTKNGSTTYSSGYEDYLIYSTDSFSVVMRYVLNAVYYDDTVKGDTGVQGGQEYYYSFNTVTEADVTPPEGVTAEQKE